MTERTFIYNEHGCEAFEQSTESTTVLIYIAGLGGELLSDPVTGFLREFCIRNQIIFCQPCLRSMPDFGTFTLKDDVDDILSLFRFYEGKRILLYGFSTGCQDILYLFKNHDIHDFRIKHAFLQGPVSDREYEEFLRKQEISTFAEMLQNKPADFMFEYFGMWYTKERWLDLYIKGGEDDFFSSDLSKEHFLNIDSQNVPMTFILCEKDEFAINDISHLLKLVRCSSTVILKSSQHCLSTNEDFTQLEFYMQKQLGDIIG